MIKIMITCRNRLSITQKCIQALQQHSTIEHQIYIYDNQTNYLLDEHFRYFNKLYTKKIISQVTFTTDESTFGAFSKAVASNLFGHQHECDPLKDNYDFLVMLDNDIIVTPKWDLYLKVAWDHVKKNKLNDIKVIGQLPGGVKRKKEEIKITEDMHGKCGSLGGSGLWSIRTNFFREIGFLNLKDLVGQSKQHDIKYWGLLEKSTNGRPYIMGLNKKLGIHCGSIVGSVCNRLTANKNDKNKNELIKFVEPEERISKMNFNEFYETIVNDKTLHDDW